MSLPRNNVIYISIFQLSGVALVIVGAWTLIFENKYSVLLGSSWFLIIVGLMIGTGGLIMIVCICGCYGVVKEHRYFLISVGYQTRVAAC